MTIHSYQSDPVVIAAAQRTPMGGFQGELSSVPAPTLGAIAIEAALHKTGIDVNLIDEVIMGCVLPAGLGQAPARQAALGANLPLSAGCTTINKMCGSGMKATMLAHDLILAGSGNVMVSGGMENMSRAPYLLDRARQGYRLGHGEIKDHMFLDGLEDAYDQGKLMGCFAEETAEYYKFSRKAQDEFAIRSLHRAMQAIEQGLFTDEITPTAVQSGNKSKIVTTDEQPHKANLEKIRTLRPAFKSDGTVTPANSSSISDGASALILMRESTANRLHIDPLARILAHSTHAGEPRWFTTAPVQAINTVLHKCGLTTDDIDLWEINEAFAVVTMSAITQLNLNVEQVNIHGGACALGHPIGASGARILTTLIHGLKQNNLKRGVASLCIGGGEATAMAVELT